MSTRNSEIRFTLMCLPLLASIALALPFPSFAQVPETPATEPTPDTAVPAVVPTDRGDLDRTAETPAADATTVPEPPEPPKPTTDEICGPMKEDTPWIDWVRDGLFRLTCGSVSWLDGLFGNRSYDSEYRKTNGVATVGGLWSQRDQFDKVLRFRARVYFPQVSERFHAFLGRENEDEIVNESRAELHGLPTQFNRNAEESVFLGLGYRDQVRPRGSFDFDAGVKIRSPIKPYVKGSYRFARKLSEQDLIRLREILFWDNEDQIGVTSIVDYDHVFNEELLVRWSGSATFAQETEGVRWYSNVALYHLVSEKRAFAYEVSADGSTDRAVSLSNYGFTTVYRQRVLREWLTMDIRTGINWPRYSPEEVRHSNLFASLAFELSFGRN